MPKLALVCLVSERTAVDQTSPISCRYIPGSEAATKIYYLVTKTRVQTTCPGMFVGSALAGSQNRDLANNSPMRNHYTSKPKTGEK